MADNRHLGAFHPQGDALSGQVEADDAPLAKIDGQFRHLQGNVHIAHCAND